MIQQRQDLRSMKALFQNLTALVAENYQLSQTNRNCNQMEMAYFE